MFTGLIQHHGQIAAFLKSPGSATLQVQSSLAQQAIVIGESIAVNGCCLTVTECQSGHLTFELGEETLRRTAFEALSIGAKVHLERALQLSDRLGGHIVQGHVDTCAELISRAEMGDAWLLTLQMAGEYRRYTVAKGSITLDGVSLTLVETRLNNAGLCEFSVMIIPHTQTQTRLGDWRIGERIHAELDVLAKYVEALLTPYSLSQTPR